MWNGYGWVPIVTGGGRSSATVPLIIVGVIVIAVVVLFILLASIGSQIRGVQVNNVFSNISNGLSTPFPISTP